MWMRNKGVTYVGHKSYFLRYSYYTVICWLKKWESATNLSRRGIGSAASHFESSSRKILRPSKNVALLLNKIDLQGVAKELSGFHKCKRDQIIQWFPSLSIS